jgi:hypothetical protein
MLPMFRRENAEIALVVEILIAVAVITIHRDVDAWGVRHGGYNRGGTGW